ncbi:MAG: CRTAC1 family protein [Planctomycetes bacterium]|nr:CRTAC1 family protein [Planctomycetota bacterium]
MLIAALLISTLATTSVPDAEELHYLSVLVEDPRTGALIEAAEIVSAVGDEVREHYVVLPEVHESELVPRLVPFDGEVELYLWSASRVKRLSAQLSYIDHDPSEQLVESDGNLLLLSDMRLPWKVSYQAYESAVGHFDLDLIPELARLDGSRALRDDIPVASRSPSIELETLPPSENLDAHRRELAWIALYGLDGRKGRSAPGCYQALHSERWNKSYWSLTGCDQLILAATADVHLKRRVPTNAYAQLEFSPSTFMRGSVQAQLEDLHQWAADPEQAIRLRGDVPAPPDEELSRTWVAVIRIEPESAGKSLSATRRASVRHGDSKSRFADEARFARLGMVHMEGPRWQLDIRPTMGPGAAWGDVDGDGLVDLYLVQGGGREGSAVPRNRLYKNRGGGNFIDVTESSQTGDQGAGMGALFCDLDSDGDLDLYVANYGRDVLYWNDGKGVFTKAADGVLPDLDLWSAGVAAADYDKDGDLDLYVTSYLDYDESKMPPLDELERYQREDPVAMLPFAFPGQRNVFLRSDLQEDGSRVFSDVTEELGLLDVQGRGMQAIFWDFDQDGDDDLYVANDVSYNTLFRNEGDGSFRDVTFLVGLDDPRGGMGLTVGDVDRDGDEDLFLTNWQLEANALYQNNLINRAGRKLHTGTFADHTVQSRLGPAGIGVTSWGCELFDADNDGDLDLFVANGYTSPDYESTGICVGQPNHFFLNDGRGRFTEAFEEGGAALAERLPSRGAVACDYDQDGLLDLLVTANNSRVQLLHNRGKSLGHWLTLRLAGSNGNTHAIGARVEAHCGDDAFIASLRAGTGYLTGNAPELHLGLGAHQQVDELTIHWPSGRTTTHRDLTTDRVLTIEEPD